MCKSINKKKTFQISHSFSKSTKMSGKHPFPAENLRISNCIYDEDVTVVVSSNGITVHLAKGEDRNCLEIYEEDISQIGCYLNEVSCTVLISISEDCVSRLETQLEMDDPPEQRLIIIKLPSESLSIAMTHLQETFGSKVIDLDEEDYDDAIERYFERSDPKLLLYPPPRPKVRSIQVNRHDYKTLAVGNPLNDVIIEFYLRYLQEDEFTDDQRRRTHIFDTFFFNQLYSSGYQQVKSRTRKVNLFDKDFIVVPINQKNQWLLTIICFASNFSAENSRNKPCIVFFDSLATDPWDHVADTLREYLQNEYESTFKDTVDINADNMPHYHVNVPQQDNQYDSGLFMLQYAELFFKGLITDYTSLFVLNEQLEYWFDAEEFQSMRYNLSKLITELVKEHNPKQLPMPKIDVDIIDITN